MHACNPFKNGLVLTGNGVLRARGRRHRDSDQDSQRWCTNPCPRYHHSCIDAQNRYSPTPSGPPHSTDPRTQLRVPRPAVPSRAQLQPTLVEAEEHCMGMGVVRRTETCSSGELVWRLKSTGSWWRSDRGRERKCTGEVERAVPQSPPEVLDRPMQRQRGREGGQNVARPGIAGVRTGKRRQCRWGAPTGLIPGEHPNARTCLQPC